MIERRVCSLLFVSPEGFSPVLSYVFRVPMEYGARPTAYPTFGARLVLDGPKISRIDHELIADELVSDQEIAEISNQQLSILWDVISYVSGYPARRADRRVERLGTANSPTGTVTQERCNPD